MGYKLTFVFHKFIVFTAFHKVITFWSFYFLFHFFFFLALSFLKSAPVILFLGLATLANFFCLGEYFFIGILVPVFFRFSFFLFHSWLFSWLLFHSMFHFLPRFDFFGLSKSESALRAPPLPVAKDRTRPAAH
jgi:hypothetical protein